MASTNPTLRLTEIIPGANGQGESIKEVKESLRGAIELILEDRRADLFRGLPEDVIRDKVMVA